MNTTTKKVTTTRPRRTADDTLRPHITQIRKSIEALRPHFPGKSDVMIASEVLKPSTTGPRKVTAEDILPFVRKMKQFSTSDVGSTFRVSEGSARSLVAILRIKRVIEAAGKSEDGSSLWRYVGG